MAHAHGGQCKYFGHTIRFPQDITNITNSLPCMLSDIDILFIAKSNPSHTTYAFFINRSQVLPSLQYKIANDPYDKDVHLNPFALFTFPELPTDVSPFLRHVNTTSSEPQENLPKLYDPSLLHPFPYDLHPSSFVSTLPIPIPRLMKYLPT